METCHELRVRGFVKLPSNTNVKAVDAMCCVRKANLKARLKLLDMSLRGSLSPIPQTARGMMRVRHKSLHLCLLHGKDRSLLALAKHV